MIRKNKTRLVKLDKESMKFVLCDSSGEIVYELLPKIGAILGENITL